MSRICRGYEIPFLSQLQLHARPPSKRTSYYPFNSPPCLITSPTFLRLCQKLAKENVGRVSERGKNILEAEGCYTVPLSPVVKGGNSIARDSAWFSSPSWDGVGSRDTWAFSRTPTQASFVTLGESLLAPCFHLPTCKRGCKPYLETGGSSANSLALQLV